MRRLRVLSVLPGLLWGGCLGGCASSNLTPEQRDALTRERTALMTQLQAGNARGHFTVTSRPTLTAEFGNKLSLGMGDTSLSFSGEIDFSRPAGAGEQRP